MNDEAFQLLLRHGDGQADAAQTARVNELLRRDPEARAMLRSLAVQAVALGDLAATRALHAPRGVAAAGKIVRPNFARPLLALAACVALLLGGAWWWRDGGGEKKPVVAASFHGPAVVTLAETAGTVWFREAQGTELHTAEVGAALPAGVLLTEGSMSSALLRFADGSEVALAADTELAFADEGKKQLTVRAGLVSAQVRPQPPGRPMIIRTATAELLVLGTVLTVTVEPERTRLEVEKGAVKMTRLADGQSVDVRQDFSATALSTAQGKLSADPRSATLAASWQADFASGLPRGWKLGQWTTEVGEDGRAPGFVRAEIESAPIVNGKPTRKPNHTIGTTNAWIDGTQVLAGLREGSVLRMTVRKARAGWLHVIVCVRSLDGDRLSLGTDVLKFDNPPGWDKLPVGAWGEVTARLAAPTLRNGGHTATAREKGVFYIAITTGDRDLGLEMKSIQMD